MAQTRKYKVIALLALLITGIGCVLGYKLLTDESWRYRSEMVRANEAIVRIEEFKKNNGRAPESLEELPGTPDAYESIFYESSGNGYKIWFGTVLGESMTFDSASGWRKTID